MRRIPGHRGWVGYAPQKITMLKQGNDVKMPIIVFPQIVNPRWV